MKSLWTIALSGILLTGCAASEPAGQDFPDPGELSCQEAWETSGEIASEGQFLKKQGSGEPLDIAITATRLKAYQDKLAGCENELSDEHFVDGFRFQTRQMKLGHLEEYARENPYSFDS